MEKLFIASTSTTPEIDFDGNKGDFKIVGRSFPENVFEFYTEVLNYIDAFVKDPSPVTNVTFNLNYFNTASYKIIVKMLLAFTKIDKNRSKVTIKWLSHKNDLTIIEKGEELKEYINLNFEIVQE